MKLLKELLKEVWSAGSEVAGERVWQQHAAGVDEQWWVVTPEKKRYGPFTAKEKAEYFMANRRDLPRGSQVKSATAVRSM